ncbi:MAG: ribonuclease [Bacteroidota bacterium]
MINFKFALNFYILIFRRFYNLYISPDKQFTHSLMAVLGFCPKNLAVYHLAFRHSSTNSNLDGNNNERLEMLGDSVLSFVVADYLFKKFPSRREGFLTEMRSKMVSRQSMNEIASDMSIQNFIRFGSNIKSIKDNDILGNALEALIGAIYLDKGFMATQNFILDKFIRNHIDIYELEKTEFNFKSKLLNWSQTNRHAVEFKVLEERKIKNRTLYSCGVFVNTELKGKGENFNKKQAEKQAAENACKELAI